MRQFIVRLTSKNCGLVLQYGTRAASEEEALTQRNPWGLKEENYYISIKEV